ncbi:FMN-dependent dehydrogenase-domain-containing protein [Pseudomassariella vexata]|uniref:L-lactate dehydrogenase (cytochrome) n=1 Tax=Pseudomassariella vexata TaxID=1141098 RepID=A0A1Y2E3A0_9PEZI|nr:FMN-dependent dehydrogenase-domain-containing protein [Pseudomassariella vexata]ORY66002.1 FMN-dependent dehydrogenase-domain-containing protein [Pseudomassariella vexata]
MADTQRVQVSVAELSRHNTKHDCWIAIHSKVWDLTEFIDEHPGGAGILLRCAGKNATNDYDQVHAPAILEENLPSDRFKGILEEAISDIPPKGTVTEARQKNEATQNEENPLRNPELHTLISAADFEKIARTALTPKTWAFYSSAATDLITHHQNKAFLRRIMIQPRVLRDVRKADFSRTILGNKTAAPFFISPAAMARLVHPDGELALAKAAAAEGIIQCISNNASYPLGSITQSTDPQQTFFFQLYVNIERQKTTELLLKARDLGIKAIFVTVDAPVPGKREADERIAAVAIQSAISGATASNDKKGGGLGRLMAQYIDKALQWSDLAWIKETSGLPVVLKGVQSVEDAKLAVEYGVDGILLSNHGGRSLDTSQPAILNLLELRMKCPEIFAKLEVYVDGGFERGTDILKALALGATAVGVGRPYLYSLVYGQEGTQHLTQILKDEIEVSMRLCGLTSLDQISPDLINTSDIDYLVRSSNKFPDIANTRGRAKL